MREVLEEQICEESDKWLHRKPKMDDDHDIDDVSKNLKAMGLLVTRVDADQKAKRCDLSAKDAHETCLLEVKAINDEEEIKETVRHSRVFEMDRSHVFRSRVAKEIPNAMKQLQSTASGDNDDLWLVR